MGLVRGWWKQGSFQVSTSKMLEKKKIIGMGASSGMNLDIGVLKMYRGKGAPRIEEEEEQKWWRMTDCWKTARQKEQLQRDHQSANKWFTIVKGSKQKDWTLKESQYYSFTASRWHLAWNINISTILKAGILLKSHKKLHCVKKKLPPALILFIFQHRLQVSLRLQLHGIDKVVNWCHSL